MTGGGGGVYDGTDTGAALAGEDPNGEAGAGACDEAYGDAAAGVGVNGRTGCSCAGAGDDGVATDGQGARGVGRSGGRVAGRGGVGDRGRAGAAG